jgi:hypothetical protein
MLNNGFFITMCSAGGLTENLLLFRAPLQILFIAWVVYFLIYS